MNSIIESLNLWGARFLEFIVPMLWQSSLLIALIFILDFALRRKVRAAIRYALWFVVLLKLLLPPTLAFPTSAAWWLRTNKPEAPAPRRILTVSYSEPTDYVPEPAITIPAPPPPRPQLSSAAWMLLTSAVGTIFLLTWLLARWRQITSQIRQSSPAPPQIVELFNQINYEARSPFHRPRSSRRELAPSSPHGLSQSGRTPEPPSARYSPSPPRSGGLEPLGKRRKERGEATSPLGPSEAGASESLGRGEVVLRAHGENSLDVGCSMLDVRCPRIPAEVRLVAAPISPAVCGLFRPVILLPQTLTEKLSPAQLRAVLLHELIHLRRRDVWMNCFQTFLQIAYWWHPLLWLANARIRRLREESVDDAVMLALNENSEVYAPTLLEVAKLAFNRPLASLGLVGILESKNALRQRIERLLNFTTPRRAGLSIMSVVCIAAFTAFAVPMGEAPPHSSDPGASLDSTNLIPYHTQVDPEVFIRNIRARANETMHTTNEHWGEILLSILDGYGIDCTPPRGIALNNKTGELTTQNTSEALQVLDEVIHELNLPGGERILNPPYGLKQVLIEAHFYQMQPEQFAELHLDSAKQNRDRTGSPSWQLTSNQVSRVSESIKQLGLQAFSSPRIQTSHGTQADMFIGDKTNEIELQCEPYIRDGAVDLTVLARTTGTYAPPGGWPDFAGRTNCPIFSRIGFEDGGGAVLQAQAAETAPQSNLVVLLRARIIQQTAMSSNRSATRPTISPQRQKLFDKLDHIVVDKFPSANLQLSEIVRILLEQTKLHDPEHNGINFILSHAPPTHESTPPTNLAEVNISLDPAIANVPLADVLSNIVKSADHPIKYSVLDFGVEFSFGDSTARAPEADASVSGAMDTIHTSSQQQKIYRKLNDLAFDKIGFPGLSLSEVISNLAEMAKRRDPSHEGINLFINETPAKSGASSKLADVTISLDPPLTHVRLIDVLEAMVNTADHPIRFTVRDNGVEFSLAQRNSPELITRTFKIAPDRMTNILQSRRIKYDALDSQAALKILEQSGVRLVPPESCSYDAQNGILTVHAAQNNMYELTTDDGLVPVLGIDLNTSMQDGKLLFERGKLDEAEARFQEVLQRDPDNQAALYYLNLIKQQRTRYTTDSDSSNLQTHNFQLDPNTLCLNLQNLGFANFGPRTRVGSGYVQPTGPKTEIQIGLVNFFQATGVDLSPPKSVFFDDHQNTLTVHATPHDLDLVQAAIKTLNVAPPEVNIRARFVEVAATRESSGRIHPVRNAFTDFMENVLTNQSDSEFISGILSESQMKSALKLVQNTNLAKFANEFQVTTLSGRQAQVSDVDVSTVVNGLNVSATNNQTDYKYQTTNMSFGYVLDVLPEILSDQRAISMRLIPSVTEFLGYADPKEISKYDKNLQHAQLPLPKYRRWSITTTAIIPDSQTLVLANLTDKILVGAGPMYKAMPKKDSNKQLLVFITPTLIDRAGNRLYAETSKDSNDNSRDYLRALRSNDYYDGPIQ